VSTIADPLLHGRRNEIPGTSYFRSAVKQPLNVVAGFFHSYNSPLFQDPIQFS
jgi:hypothetical protein